MSVSLVKTTFVILWALPGCMPDSEPFVTSDPESALTHAMFEAELFSSGMPECSCEFPNGLTRAGWEREVANWDSAMGYVPEWLDVSDDMVECPACTDEGLLSAFVSDLTFYGAKGEFGHGIAFAPVSTAYVLSVDADADAAALDAERAAAAAERAARDDAAERAAYAAADDAWTRRSAAYAALSAARDAVNDAERAAAARDDATPYAYATPAQRDAVDAAYDVWAAAAAAARDAADDAADAYAAIRCNADARSADARSAAR